GSGTVWGAGLAGRGADDGGPDAARAVQRRRRRLLLARARRDRGPRRRERIREDDDRALADPAAAGRGADHRRPRVARRGGPRLAEAGGDAAPAREGGVDGLPGADDEPRSRV